MIKLFLKVCFRNNKGDSGTGIFLARNADNSIIRNSQFIGNAGVRKGEDGFTEGGALDSHGSNTLVKNCTFRDNSAVRGGALCFNNGTGNVVIDSTFINNNAPDGGAIRLISTETSLQNNTFRNNYVNNNGGAIIVSSSKINMKKNIFINNKATKGQGGAIHIISGTFNISNSKFHNNTAKIGGSIYTNIVLSAINTIFKNNKASGNGGAIYSTKNLNINGGSVTSNTAIYGSGIYVKGALKISKTSFSGNLGKIFSVYISLSKNKINAGNKLTVKSSVKSGDNALGAIYSKGVVTKNGTNIKLSNKPPGKKIILRFNGKNYSRETDKTGIAKFKLDTKKLKGNYKATSTFVTKPKTLKAYKTVKILNVAKSNKKPKNTTHTNSNKKTSNNRPITAIGQSNKVTSLDKVHANMYIKPDTYKITHKKISYWNYKSAIVVNFEYYKIDERGWYIGDWNDKKQRVTSWKSIKPGKASGINWYLLNPNGEKWTVGNITTKFKNNTYNVTLFYMSVTKSKSISGLYKPYINYTYQCKLENSTKTISVLKLASYDVYFTDSSFSKARINELVNKKDGRVQVNNSRIKNVILNIFTGKNGYGSGISGELTPDKKIRKIFNWMNNKVKYKGYECSHLTATKVLSRMYNPKLKEHANCADQSILLVTLLRTAGIPAEFENWFGCRFGRSISGHVWVQAYWSNTKKYKLDTTSSRNGVNDINNWRGGRKDYSVKSNIIKLYLNEWRA
ncbi:transglutaminase domain-containing protein [Methanobrevibacter filiformis]|uniref:Transglutaminase-like superfamily protein n=1 Tax=Methanobrevibacter filiformis TaxID=55758 RepID=A0A166C421_9EURY|nr:transglutaminase domain-containing protein [Methanobrevibacter filiformis]KZX11067.1 transglutaminase-like superfamily protein [Methanobrevibacter filiformis]